MQVSVENTSSLERRMTVSIPADRLSSVIDGRLRDMAGKANLKGFRKGKVPTKVIEQRFGDQIRSEAFGELVRASFDQAVRQENVRIAGQPSIQADPGAAENEIRYTATFEIVPDFGTIDVSQLQIVRVHAQVEDADIDHMIDTLRQQRRTWEPVTRAAQVGDLVAVETFAATASARVPETGAEKGATVIGSGVMFPELEAQLSGMSAGDEREVEVTFPADWRVPALAGQNAKVTLKATQVSEPKVPEADEAFVKSFGVKSGKLDVFRQEVRANLERELKGMLMSRLRAEVAQKLVAAYSHVELPAKLIEAEARNLAANAQQQARQQGQADAVYPFDQFMVPARNRVAAGLLVGEIARQNGLKLDFNRVKETLSLIASTYEEPKQVIELYRNDPNLMSGLQNRVMEEQVIDWVAERAQSTDQNLSFTEAMRPV
ncbi:trigger factor [Arenimonas maotaiensis]|uniref:Trigger factor n=1 Tax=Arenimonas maotaiensis TaxID=1446479 RepID=A0A917CMH9_9GAMM|nr:trigger factor [Arenimonas maotaiensis]GGF92132.1 trigger factor [Arenimonas maotaiensis]